MKTSTHYQAASALSHLRQIDVKSWERIIDIIYENDAEKFFPIIDIHIEFGKQDLDWKEFIRKRTRELCVCKCTNEKPDTDVVRILHRDARCSICNRNWYVMDKDSYHFIH